MQIVQVFIRVRPERVEDFLAATLENCRHSVQEQGIARFDLLRQQDDPTRFVLVEVYRTPEDPARHKQTAHYLKWRETVEPMMAEPRRAVQSENLFPADQGWG